MPRVGIQCAVDLATVTDEQCLACRLGAPRAGKHCDFSYEMLAAIMDSSGRQTAYVSASGTDPVCPRQDWLLERDDYIVNPSQAYHAARGTMAHTWMQSWPQPGAIYEQRYQVMIDGFDIPFTGQLDKHWEHLEGEWTIEDGKSKKDDKLPDKGALKSNVIQLNCYRYLLKYGSPQKPITFDSYGMLLPHGRQFLPGTPANINVTKLVLYYFSMSRPQAWEAPIMSDDEVHDIIVKTMTNRTSEIILPVPVGMTPWEPSETGFCQNWCPVRQNCLASLLDE